MVTPKSWSFIVGKPPGVYRGRALLGPYASKQTYLHIDGNYLKWFGRFRMWHPLTSSKHEIAFKKKQITNTNHELIQVYHLLCCLRFSKIICCVLHNLTNASIKKDQPASCNPAIERPLSKTKSKTYILYIHIYIYIYVNKYSIIKPDPRATHWRATHQNYVFFVFCSIVLFFFLFFCWINLESFGIFWICSECFGFFSDFLGFFWIIWNVLEYSWKPHKCAHE